MAAFDGVNTNREAWLALPSSIQEDEIVWGDDGEKISIWMLEWRDVDHAHDWYLQHSKRVGFGIQCHCGHKVQGIWRDKTWVCSKEGERKQKNVEVKFERAETRCGCEVMFGVKRQESGFYWANKWQARHNHLLFTSTKSQFIPCHRRIDDFSKIGCDDAEAIGLRPKQAHDIMAIQAGGRELLGFTKQDLRNYLVNRKGPPDADGGAQAILDYFGDQREQNSLFFFKAQLDPLGLITNIFWSDPSMQVDYECFGDFVSFDTTFRTNKTTMPLGVFVGLNHHKKQVVFGACLLYDETADTFRWLFETFLHCIKGKMPQSIFTDQDAAMLAAIPTVLTESRHFLCVWHINQNAMKNLGALFGNVDFKRAWDHLLWSGDELDFEGSWGRMINEHGLHQNEWLRRTYSFRYMWAPLFVRDTFCAGKRTTQSSESFNARLRSYLKCDLRLERFCHHFQRAVDDLRYNELEAHFNMLDKLPKKIGHDPLIDHVAKLYTPAMFDVFQNEVIKVPYIKIDSQQATVDYEEYTLHVCTCVLNCSQATKQVISFYYTLYSCSCKHLTYVGVLCCHIIGVMRIKGFLGQIPEQYVSKRWTRSARDVSAGTSVGNEKDAKRRIALKQRRLLAEYGSIITKFSSDEATWPEFDRIRDLLVDTMQRMSINKGVELGRVVDGPSACSNLLTQDGEDVVVTGLKRREAKNKGNKRLKGIVEKVRRKPRKAHMVPQPSSQPIARRHLDLHDDPNDGLDEVHAPCSSAPK